ncbi:hypothetical protein [Nitrobacter sp. TKz-YC01]
MTSQIIREDTTDNVGLSLIDRAIAADRFAVRVELLDDIIAVAQPTT